MATGGRGVIRRDPAGPTPSPRKPGQP